MNLVYEFTGIFHTIQRQTNILHHTNRYHSITVMRISERHTGYKMRKYPASEQDYSSIPWHIGISFFYKTRTKNHMSARIFLEVIFKTFHVRNIHLSISIKGNNIFPRIFFCILSYIFKSGFECSTTTTIDNMFEKMQRISKFFLQ